MRRRTRSYTHKSYSNQVPNNTFIENYMQKLVSKIQENSTQINTLNHNITIYSNKLTQLEEKIQQLDQKNKELEIKVTDSNLKLNNSISNMYSNINVVINDLNKKHHQRDEDFKKIITSILENNKLMVSSTINGIFKNYNVNLEKKTLEA